MITSLSTLRSWILADLARYTPVPLTPRRTAADVLRQPQTRFQILLRVTEYLHNSGSGPASAALGALARWRLQGAGIRLGYTIPVNTFGPGLKLPHWGTIIVSGDARIGTGCTCHPGVLIGTRAGAPSIGSGVYLGNGAKLYGPITIGDGATIAPNAVVTKNVPPGDVVGGVPGRSMRSAHRETSVNA